MPEPTNAAETTSSNAVTGVTTTGGMTTSTTSAPLLTATTTTAPATTAPTPEKQPPWGDEENFNAEKAWELIQNLRNEKADPAASDALSKANDDLKAANEQLKAIAEAITGKSQDSPPDPAKLAEQVTAEQGRTAEAETRASTAERQLAVFKIAAHPDVAGNPLALTDSTSFMASIKEIDPSDGAKLAEAVAAAIEANPLFKASPTPYMPPLNGGPRTPAPQRAGSLEEAIAARFSSTTR